MRFVPVKTIAQQSALLMHRIRDLLIRQRTMMVNALRGHMAEFGRVDLHKMAGLIAIVMNDKDERIPDIARQALKMITGQINELQMRIAALETQILAWHTNNPVSQRLATIPGIGPIIATAIAATVAVANVFRTGREFAAWLGLVPTQSSRHASMGLANEEIVISAVFSSTAHTRCCFVRRQPRSALDRLPAQPKAASCRCCGLGK